ncbi:ArsO family NAD(P)H-dependent flavin-containing monooxygenase [Rhodocytophaga aerolata]|uniref:ArsO family NAD(P)H-dependent flavin-containing monooxygenase n=1 Tax=Rhodocytophaga aerolata TaxID=455078 RepID=A0ABT8R9C1_9BACT|nr:ArsO family NAD(P)H-dependent flavin-containing monooxygenase [Rhodocytophaga aerolata]MDO1447280.1 ArsO family NAD(P)H-dependent flavin-containing monooxygenase [Rhodocytophaga aerolata]
MEEPVHIADVVIIGGGQSGLAMGYYLRRTGLSFVILDEQAQPGGSWLHTWHSLKLFSPAEHSSLPGWLMPKTEDEYPGKAQVVNYLAEYEKKYNLPVERPVKVEKVVYTPEGYTIHTTAGLWQAKAVVSATGSWHTPYVPEYPDRHLYLGYQIHSAHYQKAEDFAGKKVLIVGGGNSSAQILAEVSKVAHTTWVTEKEPTFLPDEVDGRYLFEFATRQYKARQEGKTIQPVGSLGDIVMVASVKEARQRNVLHSVRPFKKFTATGVHWPDGREEEFDAVIWCTGFKPALDHLQPLGVIEADGKVLTNETKAVKSPGLWLVGYGSWTGYASATLIGVGRTARSTAEEIAKELRK